MNLKVGNERPFKNLKICQAVTGNPRESMLLISLVCFVAVKKGKLNRLMLKTNTKLICCCVMALFLKS